MRRTPRAGTPQRAPEGRATVTGPPGKREGYLSWEQYFRPSRCSQPKRSKDPNTQVGACIVDARRRTVGVGYSGFRGTAARTTSCRAAAGGRPRWRPGTPSSADAEPNAILNAQAVPAHARAAPSTPRCSPARSAPRPSRSSPASARWCTSPTSTATPTRTRPRGRCSGCRSRHGGCEEPLAIRLDPDAEPDDGRRTGRSPGARPASFCRTRRPGAGARHIAAP